MVSNVTIFNRKDKPLSIPWCYCWSPDQR